MFRSFQTRIRGDQPVLERYAAVMSRAEHKIFALLQAGRQWKGDIHTTLYPDFGISATHLDMVYRQLLARLQSLREIGLRHIREWELRFAITRRSLGRMKQALQKQASAIAKLVAEDVELTLKIQGLKRALGNARHVALRIRPLKTLLDASYRKRRLLARMRVGRRKLLRGLHYGQRKEQRLRHRIARERAKLERPYSASARARHSGRVFSGQMRLAGRPDGASSVKDVSCLKATASARAGIHSRV